MALTDDIERISKAVDTLSKNGVPIRVEHSFETKSLWQLVGGLALVAIFFVVLLGAKDTLVKRRT